MRVCVCVRAHVCSLKESVELHCKPCPVQNVFTSQQVMVSRATQASLFQQMACMVPFRLLICFLLHQPFLAHAIALYCSLTGSATTPRSCQPCHAAGAHDALLCVNPCSHVLSSFSLLSQGRPPPPGAANPAMQQAPMMQPNHNNYRLYLLCSVFHTGSATTPRRCQPCHAAGTHDATTQPGQYDDGWGRFQPRRNDAANDGGHATEPIRCVCVVCLYVCVRMFVCVCALLFSSHSLSLFLSLSLSLFLILIHIHTHLRSFSLTAQGCSSP